MKLLATLLLLCISLPASAEIFTWKDASGKVHFGDKPPNNTRPEQVQVEINSYTQVSIEPSNVTLSSSPGNTQSVVMYSTEWCRYCKMAREYFKAHHIPFKDHDIETSAKAKKEYKSIGGRGVPVILVGQSRMNGFSEAGFRNIYGKK